MKKDFEYSRQILTLDSISIEDIGNCFLQAYNDEGLFFCLWVKTEAGRTKIIEAGPYNVEDPSFPTKFSSNINFTQIDFSERKISDKISKFLNNFTYKITQVIDRNEEFNEEEKKEAIYNYVNFMREGVL